MKMKTILLLASVIFSSRLLAQTTIVKPMAEKTVVPAGNMQHLKPAGQPAKAVPPPAPSSNIQSASISILNGDDGKDYDTWKIQSVTINISFANDPDSPHKITWSNIVLSQDSRTRELLFDKNFNPL